MERTIPDFNKIMIHHVLMGTSTKYNEKYINKYVQKIEQFERECEKSLIETLSRISIKSIVKTDPYSLPNYKTISVTLNGESWLNAPFEFHRVAREIVRKLLNDHEQQLRFYMYINIIEGYAGFGKVEYQFRYHIKE